MTDKVTFKINKIVSFRLSEAQCEEWRRILNSFVLNNTLTSTVEISIPSEESGTLAVDLSKEEVLFFRQQLLDRQLTRFNRAALFLPNAGDAKND